MIRIGSADDDASERLLSDLSSEDASVRYAAWRGAAVLSPDALPRAATLGASDDWGIAKAACGALSVCAHAAAAPGHAADARGVSAQLLAIGADAGRPVAVRALALRLVGLIGDRTCVSRLAALLSDAAVRDEARMALETIPGQAAVQELQRAQASCSADFRPALRQSISARSTRTY